MTAWQQRSMRRIAFLALLPLIVGCGTRLQPVPYPASASPHPTPTASETAASSPAGAAPASGGPAFDPTLITQICESWKGRRSDRGISCGKGIKAALDSLGGRAAEVERIYLRYSPPCGAATCPPPSEDHAWAALRTRGAGNQLIELSTVRDGEIRASSPRLDQAPLSGPAFDLPRVARPVIRGRVPDEVRDRQPFPLCGVETAGSGGPFDARARRCFLSGVLNDQPVEFIAQGHGTEGDPALTLYRFPGGDAVTRYDREAGAWTWTACGITILGTDVVFVTDGVCRRRVVDLGP